MRPTPRGRRRLDLFRLGAVQAKRTPFTRPGAATEAIRDAGDERTGRTSTCLQQSPKPPLLLPSHTGASSFPPAPPPPCPPPPQHILDVREYSSPAYSTTRALWLLTSSVQVTRQLLRVTDDAVTRRADRKRRRWTNLSFSRDMSSSERP